VEKLFFSKSFANLLLVSTCTESFIQFEWSFLKTGDRSVRFAKQLLDQNFVASTTFTGFKQHTYFVFFVFAAMFRKQSAVYYSKQKRNLLFYCCKGRITVPSAKLHPWRAE